MDRDIEYWRGVQKAAEEMFEACRIHMDRLDGERAETAEKMRHYEQIIKSAAPLTSETDLEAMDRICEEFVPNNVSELGLADAVRQVLHKAQRYVTPVQVRDALEASGYNLKPPAFTNVLASIHGILKRFEQSGEVAMIQSGSRTSYRLHGRVPTLADAIERKVAEEEAKKKK